MDLTAKFLDRKYRSNSSVRNNPLAFVLPSSFEMQINHDLLENTGYNNMRIGNNELCLWEVDVFAITLSE